MLVASGEIFTKYDLICHVAKMKDARSVNSMADVINIPFGSNALIKPSENIFHSVITAL